jgi:hypothetical protein
MSLLQIVYYWEIKCPCGLHEFVCVINLIIKSKLKWQNGNDLVEIMDKFKDFYGLLPL